MDPGFTRIFKITAPTKLSKCIYNDEALEKKYEEIQQKKSVIKYFIVVEIILYMLLCFYSIRLQY